MQKIKQIPRVISISAAALTLGVIGVEARAGALESKETCQVDHVQVNSIINQGDSDGTNLLEGTSISAANCLGAFPQSRNAKNPAGGGPLDYSTSGLGKNLGYANEGFFLNNKEFFPDHGAFVDEDDLQDLRVEGEFVDPGWIFVSKLEIKDNAAEVETTGTVKRDVNGDGNIDDDEKYTFDADIFTMECNNGDCTSGTWTLTPPETNPSDLLAILGADKFFDQAALLLKGATEYAIYNFTLSDARLPPVLAGDTNYKFAGTWSTEGLTNAGGNPGLSHAILAFRDPTGGDIDDVVPVPEPTSLALMGLGLFGLGGMSLRRRKG